ncbi:MAG: alpha/beta hydrolase [Elusimicrobia bacterium]|nr:alpha/beta hydrolase [Elusimicrobiota bacterium]
MIFWVCAAAAVCLAAAFLGFGWWGAGLIIYPPKMSSLAVFPEQFGLPYEKVSFTTSDGLTLKGWFLPSPTGDERTLLMCHGWGDNKGELLAQTHFLNTAGGFNLFYFDNRSHGESGGTITTIGCLEIMDFDAAMDYLRRSRPQRLQRLGVFGLSMGAAVAAMAAPAHPEVKSVVMESPFTSYRQVVRRWAWNNLRVPYFPLMMIVLWMLRLRVGREDVDSYSPVRYVSGVAPRPVLFISGAEDRLMPPDDVRALYAAAREPKELWMIPGASHGKCRELAGPEYDRRLIEFFGRTL